MLPGETIRSGASTQCSCGLYVSQFKVMRSNAGFYIGTSCFDCGPYTRESHYYRTQEEAQQALDNNNVNWRK